MKRYVFLLLLIVAFSTIVEAEELSDDKLAFNSGLIYKNYIYKKYDIDDKKKKIDNDFFVREDLHQGVGYYLELIHYLNKQWSLGLGIQKIEMEANWESKTKEYKSNLNNYYSKLSYKLNPNSQLYFNLNYSNYRSNYSKESFSTDIRRGAGLGVSVGTKSNYNISSSFALDLETEYYFNNINIKERYSSYQGKVIKVDDEVLKLTGLGVSLGFNYKF